mmetsp:Transcript_7921/g.18978  ORF Transcript_7921/g.18978 Transcript_7921/m.18978 type:complete len:83 (+) Transcript_7921:237-485(+)
MFCRWAATSLHEDNWLERCTSLQINTVHLVRKHMGPDGVSNASWDKYKQQNAPTILCRTTYRCRCMSLDLVLSLHFLASSRK